MNSELFRPGAKPPADPVAVFQAFFDEAAKTEPERGTAMVLATADAEGRPSARVVLLKHFGARGFTFYTHYSGRKGRELETNPNAALCFHWPSRQWQVRAEGLARRVDAAESDAYFASRPRGSQLGAWASRQSEELTSRFALLRRVALHGAKYLGRSVPRPASWGGYCLEPRTIEFWQGRDNRLHDRWLYARAADVPGAWAVRRVFP
jgi:pyridoxamine 5'-phosphate oxidase